MASPSAPRQPLEDTSEYLLNPDDFESDVGLGRSPVYAEEAGARSGATSQAGVTPCEACGTPVLPGLTDHGRRLVVEVTAVETYTVVWQNKEPLPRLKPGRGYLLHRCRPEESP